MWLIDQLVEQQIAEAQRKGDLSDLPGSGKPLTLDDDSHVPPELRTAYRLLKNSGFLPPELEMRREAVELERMLNGLAPDDSDYQQHTKRLRLLEIKLQQAGMRTDFLHGEYRRRLTEQIEGKNDV
ncbi:MULTISPECIES: DUF1992 domain-containing protein [Erwinia]|uniref:DnaJ family domain-containing protein n=1 Tax=Erwinia TaxID=551 RepID=UPI00054F8176|nr:MULTISPECIES: DUF1992 domain-containing protein [Erwinia]